MATEFYANIGEARLVRSRPATDRVRMRDPQVPRSPKGEANSTEDAPAEAGA